MKKTIIALVVLALAVLAVLYVLPDGSASREPVATITFTEEGYSPSEIDIRTGDAVAFVNSSAELYMWPASDLHPTHELYPEFDPRQPLAPGESWSFTFEKEGEWRFHDHLKSRSRGIIRVSE